MTRVSTRCHTVKEDTNLRPLCCCCSVTQECPTLCDPMNCSTPGLPSLTISQTLPKFMAIASVIPPSHLILWWPLLLLPSIFPTIRDFSQKSAFCIRWPKYWSLGPLSHPHICICYCCLVSKSCLTLAIPWTAAHQAPLSRDFPGKNIGVGYHFLLKRIFPTQG